MKRQPRAMVVPVLILASLLAAPACTVEGTAAQAVTTSASSSATVSPPSPPVTATPTPTDPPTIFAVIGDYGRDNGDQAAVARLVGSWDPAYVVSVGDGYYATAGGTRSGRYDESTGAHYCRWLADITTSGQRCPAGQAERNAFFPAMGNHDYTDARPSPETYLDYFDLPGDGFTNTSGNERYYDFVEGPVHFFVLNSNPQEPDGIDETSSQAEWLQQQLAASESAWNIVVDHHPPYSSDADHGSNPDLQWPFADWGADVVISGHAHTYERVMRDGITYFVNGLGGSPRYKFTTPVSGSVVRYNDTWGAQRVTVTPSTLTFDFLTIEGALVDSHTVTHR